MATGHERGTRRRGAGVVARAWGAARGRQQGRESGSLLQIFEVSFRENGGFQEEWFAL